jgi:hypothetical protein
MLKVFDEILAVLKSIDSRLAKDPPINPPVFKPDVPPGEPLYPCQPIPPIHHEPIRGGGRYDQSLIFKQPFWRHEVLLLDGVTVRYTLPDGQAAAGFSISTTSMYGDHEYGPNPRTDRWLEDAAGNVLVREDGMGLNGSMAIGGRKSGPLYLNIKPRDFTGWVFVEYQ